MIAGLPSLDIVGAYLDAIIRYLILPFSLRARSPLFLKRSHFLLKYTLIGMTQLMKTVRSLYLLKFIVEKVIPI